MRTLIVAMMACCLVEAAALDIRLPVGSIVTDNDSSGKTWNQNGFLNVTFVAARAHFSSVLASQGWRHVQSIEMGREKKQEIMTWQRGDVRIILMLWKISTAKTGFAWGTEK